MKRRRPLHLEMKRDIIYRDVLRERERQDDKFGGLSIAGNLMLDTKLRILVEEVGEVARAIDLVSQDPRPHARQHLREELIQVCACAFGWLESE